MGAVASKSSNTNNFEKLNDWNADYVSIKNRKLHRKNKSSSKLPIAVILQNNANTNIIPNQLKSAFLKEINALESKNYNYRSQQFIFNNPMEYYTHHPSNFNDDHDEKNVHDTKPLIQDLIDPLLHPNLTINLFNEYVENKWPAQPDSFGSDFKIKWIPVLFEYDTKTNQYLIKSEINGIARYKYEALYKVIENIFNRTIPMFEYILKVKNLASTYNKLYAIVKCQKYIFKDGGMEYVGHWHCEGKFSYSTNIIANCLWYFDKSNLFVKDSLNICAKIKEHEKKGRCGNVRWIEDDIIDVDISKDIMVCFNNLETIHRPTIKVSTALDLGQQTRKLFAFFLIDPDIDPEMRYIDMDEMRAVNWMYKTHFIATYWMRGSKIEIKFNLPTHIGTIINHYVCGDEQYLKVISNEYRKKSESARFFNTRPSENNRWAISHGSD